MAFLYECVAISHIGNHRKNNEDNFFIGESLTAHEQASMSQSGEKYRKKRVVADSGKNRIFAVSDGMGGHQDGEVASCMAVEALGQFDSLGQERACCRRQEKFAYIQAFQDMIQQTNRNMLKYSGAEEGIGQMGATLSGAIFFADEFVPFNIGDSSTFLYERGNKTLRKLTVDDNEAARLQKIGGGKPGSKGKRLTKYFGLPESEGALTATLSSPISIQDGQTLLISSDGLTECLSQEDIVRVLSGNMGDIGATADALIGHALTAKNGGHDNITVVVIKIQREHMKLFHRFHIPLMGK